MLDSKIGPFPFILVLLVLVIALITIGTGALFQGRVLTELRASEERIKVQIIDKELKPEVVVVTATPTASLTPTKAVRSVPATPTSTTKEDNDN